LKKLLFVTLFILTIYTYANQITLTESVISNAQMIDSRYKMGYIKKVYDIDEKIDIIMPDYNLMTHKIKIIVSSKEQ